MASASIQNCDWKEDNELCETLRRLVLQNFKRMEVLDFARRDFPQYAWSLGTLARRLAHFGIRYINYEVSLDQVRAACSKESNGPGQLLGYRAMHKKLREEHNLAIPRGLVYDVMTLDHAEGMENRKVAGHKKRKRGPVGTFTSLVSKGPLTLVAF